MSRSLSEGSDKDNLFPYKASSTVRELRFGPQWGHLASSERIEFGSRRPIVVAAIPRHLRAFFRTPFGARRRGQATASSSPDSTELQSASARHVGDRRVGQWRAHAVTVIRPPVDPAEIRGVPALHFPNFCL